MSYLEKKLASKQSNILFFSIFLFIVLYAAFVLISPSFAFDKKGRARQFGIGIKNKSIIPAWLISILIAILSYTIVLYVTHNWY